LSVLQQLPQGTILDGELVHLTQGRADFRQLLCRHQLVSPAKIRRSAGQEPASYVVFDLLQLAGRCLLSQPLQQRREQLQQLLASAGQPRLMFSPGVITAGQQFFQEVIQQGHEGVMAKHLNSPYRPGKRASQWRKIKPRQQVVCVIIGYQILRGRLDGLLLAAQHAARLQYVGSVSSGLTEYMRRELQPLLANRTCAQPIIPAPETAHWVRPDLYCEVRCFGFTPQGRLRFPHLQRLFPLAMAPSLSRA
jgi:ATP-dependent DNA ligase